MFGFIVRIVVSAAGLLVIANLINGIEITGFGAALIAVLVLGVVNAIIRPILLFLTLPLNVMTLGLFTLVINGLLLLLVASVVAGFEVKGFFAAVIGTILMSIVSAIANKLVR